jgi:hypothetical protein
MEKPLIASYCWNWENYHLANSLFVKARTSLAHHIARWLGALVFLAGGIYLAVEPNSKSGFLAALIGIGLAVYLLLYPRISFHFAVRRGFKNMWRKSADQDVHYEIHEKSVLIEGSLGYSEISWRIFEEAILSPHGIVLLTESKTELFWLPKHCFSDEDYELLEDLVERRIEKVKRLN